MGIDKTLRHVEAFGFKRSELPRDLSLALGSANLTSLQIASGYSVLASGGYRTEPYYTQRVQLVDGDIVFEANPQVVCPSCTEAPVAEPEIDEIPEPETVASQPPVTINDEFGLFPAQGSELEISPIEQPVEIEASNLETSLVAGHYADQGLVNMAPLAVNPQNVYLVYDMMRSVIQRGTGVRAYRELKRQDIAGKTGTTNDRRDAWFSGFNADLVATAWVGFDQERSLGRREEGGRTALPLWIYFMREALAGTREHPLEPPAGLVTVRIDPQTGKLAAAGDRNAIFETFRENMLPGKNTGNDENSGNEDPFNLSGDDKKKDDDALF